MKKNIKISIISFIVGISLPLLLLMILVPVALIESLGDDRNEDYNNATKEVKSLTKGITANSFDEYYSVHGLIGITEYLAFSLPKKELWPVALKISKLIKEDFVKEVTLDGPHTWNQEESILFLPKKLETAWQGEFILHGGIRSMIVVSEKYNRLYFKMVSSD